MAFNFGGSGFGSAAPAATTTPGGFGTPQAKPTTPTFGAVAPTTPSAFGAPSLFGAAAPTSTSTPATGLFGAPAANAPTTTPSLFGAAPAAKPTTSLFGAPAAATTAPTTSLFGAPATAPSSTPSLFGGSASTATPSLFGSFTQQPTPFGAATGLGQTPNAGGFGFSTGTAAPSVAPGATTFSTAMYLHGEPQAAQELQDILDAYNPAPTNNKFRFRHLFLNIVSEGMEAARVKPAGVDESQWQEALEELKGSAQPEKMWPVAANGFGDLAGRLKAQEEWLANQQTHIADTDQQLRQLQRHFHAKTLPQIQMLRRQHIQHSQQLLRLMRMLEALDQRAFEDMPLTGEEVQLSRRLEALSQQLPKPPQQAQLQHRLDSLSKLATAHSAAGGSAPAASLDSSSLKHMHEILKQQTEGVRRLSSVCKKASRDSAILVKASHVSGEK
mmetsp:Transcript_3141/g.11313  ORF Transcript_3141/g.11313 Transcript_3141/m.11313 type:complete len:443 (-) Transcript_3141:33-1361(-)